MFAVRKQIQIFVNQTQFYFKMALTLSMHHLLSHHTFLRFALYKQLFT